MTDLSSDIATNATNPRSAEADGVSASQHSLPDQIAADKYLKAQAAKSSKRRSFTLLKLKPPGTV